MRMSATGYTCSVIVLQSGLSFSKISENFVQLGCAPGGSQSTFTVRTSFISSTRCSSTCGGRLSFALHAKRFLARYRAVVESERQHQAASTNGVARLNIAADQLSRARLLVSDAEQLLPAVARVQAQTFSSPKRTRHGQFSEHEEWKWGGHLEEPDLDGKVPDVPEVLVWAISRAEDLIKQSHDSMTPWLTTNTAMYVSAV